jgi:hypothetical protein
MSGSLSAGVKMTSCLREWTSTHITRSRTLLMSQRSPISWVMSILSGELDPATPAANVELISPLFPNSEHALFECLGHDVSRISNLANGACVVDKVRAFLDDPSAALPNCEPELCAGMPLAPNQSELVRQLSDYVESFEDLGD